MDDIALLQQLRSGSEEAWRILYKKYYKLLCLKAFDILGDDDDAEDAVQELFENLWLKGNKLKIQEQLKSYLIISIRNRCFDKIDKKKTERKYADQFRYLNSNKDYDDNTPGDLEEINPEELALALKVVAEHKYYLPFIEKCLGEKSSKDIAQQLQIQPGTLRKGLHELSKRLKNQLTQKKNS